MYCGRLMRGHICHFTAVLSGETLIFYHRQQSVVAQFVDLVHFVFLH